MKTSVRSYDILAIKPVFIMCPLFGEFCDFAKITGVNVLF